MNQESLLENATSKSIIGSNKRTMISLIIGYWVEDKNNRRNSDNFLFEQGSEISMNDDMYSQGWKDEKVIYIDGNEITINSVRGPDAQPYQFKASLDNETFSEIDIGLLGGPTNATADMSENVLTLYVLKPRSPELLLTISYTIDSSDTNILVVKFKHIESNRYYTSLFRKQYIKDNGT